MQISVDPTATLQAVTKTEQALEDLEEIFETCDLATFYVAAALEHGAPGLSDSVLASPHARAVTGPSRSPRRIMRPQR